MDNTWEIMSQELAHNGIRVKGDICYFKDENDQIKQSEIDSLISSITSDIKENLSLFSNLWVELANTLRSGKETETYITDKRTQNLFIYSIKNMMDLIDNFSDKKNTSVAQVVMNALSRDINKFSMEQSGKVIDLSLAISWMRRVLCKQKYVCNLLRFAKTKGRNSKHKLARSVSGPWANLDLPMEERAWAWEDEDPNFRYRDKDIRNQSRYTKGLENYNGDGRVGEGHYWRELCNEPYLWEERDEESPYPHRNTTTRP
jgi:hypothetical protein